MTSQYPVRDPGDAWVEGPNGARYWGRFGAAGLMAVDAVRGILLQHRVAWSHFGGTWGLPGGALHRGEDAVTGAIREAQEEAGVPPDAIVPRFTSVFDTGGWTYTTVVATVVDQFEPVISDPESVALEWVSLDAVEGLSLHPGFAAAWPRLRELLDAQPSVVVDAANVVGSVPDGWWRDRAGATERLRNALIGLWVPASDFDLATHEWRAEVVMVVEGQARSIADVPEVTVVRAAGSGDDQIVAEVSARSLQKVIVVTSDRELQKRVRALGAVVRSPSWLRGPAGLSPGG